MLVEALFANGKKSFSIFKTSADLLPYGAFNNFSPLFQGFLFLAS
jgi:hypothetical protein